MKLDRKSAWLEIKGQMGHLMSELARIGAEKIDVTVALSEQGRPFVDWGTTGQDLPGFDMAMTQPAANPPLDLFTRGSGDDAQFFMDFHDRDVTLREAANAALENLAIFATVTSGQDSTPRVEVFGRTAHDDCPLVCFSGRVPAECWIPPETDEPEGTGPSL